MSSTLSTEASARVAGGQSEGNQHNEDSHQSHDIDNDSKNPWISRRLTKRDEPFRSHSARGSGERETLAPAKNDPGRSSSAEVVQNSDLSKRNKDTFSESPVRSMFNGNRTTVPQSMVALDLNDSHHPNVRRSRPRIRQFSVQSREHFELKCCRIHVLLVVMEFCLGVVVTALSFYMRTITPSLPIAECPSWSGLPLLVSGVLGIYFCATDFSAYSNTIKAHLTKASCFLFSLSCVVICMVAAAFTGIHGNRIASYHRCDLNISRCECFETSSPISRIRVYESITNCDTVFTSIKDYLILQCALNAIASGVCLWFVTLLWRAKYQSFYGNLQFYTFNAS